MLATEGMAGPTPPSLGPQVLVAVVAVVAAAAVLVVVVALASWVRALAVTAEPPAAAVLAAAAADSIVAHKELVALEHLDRVLLVDLARLRQPIMALAVAVARLRLVQMDQVLLAAQAALGLVVQLQALRLLMLLVEPAAAQLEVLARLAPQTPATAETVALPAAISAGTAALA
jgi:hypothetical protein